MSVGFAPADAPHRAAPGLAVPGAPGRSRLVPLAFGAALAAGTGFAAWPSDRGGAVAWLAAAALVALVSALTGPPARRDAGTLVALALAFFASGGATRRLAD